MNSPGLHIPVDDYEAHMHAVGQSAALRDLFAHIYAEHRPRRLAVLAAEVGFEQMRVHNVGLPGGNLRARRLPEDRP